MTNIHFPTPSFTLCALLPKSAVYAAVAVALLAMLSLSSMANTVGITVANTPTNSTQSGANNAQAQSSANKRISIEMTKANELQNWVIINDTVMGGRSESSIASHDNHLKFSGDLSMRNNGGFASVRRVYQAVNWQANSPIYIVVKGDGRSYQFRVRTNRYADGVAYVKAFTTIKGEWQTISFEQNEFTAQFRGRLVPGAKPLVFSDITQLGFMLADKTPGGFELDIKQIYQTN